MLDWWRKFIRRQAEMNAAKVTRNMTADEQAHFDEAFAHMDRAFDALDRAFANLGREQRK